MKLFEFEGKQLFSDYGIPTPRGELLRSEGDEVSFGPPAVFKAQVLTGGRGKAGGIAVWSGEQDFSSLRDGLLNTNIKGEPVAAVLVEEQVTILNEYYLALTYDGGRAAPVLIASGEGGVDIEEVADKTPEKIIRLSFDSRLGPANYQLRQLAGTLGCDDFGGLRDIVLRLFRLFRERDASLVEINPLAATSDGLVALDSKVVLDDKAEYRHEELFSELRQDRGQLQMAELPAEDLWPGTITYVGLDGTIGMISDGAGTGMLTLDLIRDAGGEAADFCEMGGMTNPEVMYQAMKAVLQNPRVESLLIVLIGGFNRMDEMAEGILKYREKHGLDVPMVVRMCGTLEEVGNQMMEEAGIPTYEDLHKSVKAAVRKAQGGDECLS